MSDRGRHDRLKGLEKTFTLIILVGCLVSLYLSNMSSPAHTRLAIMGKGYVLRTDKGQARNGVFGQMFGAHKHRNIFQNSLLRDNETPDPLQGLLSNSSQSTVTAEVDETAKWFEPLPVIVKAAKFDHRIHPYFRNFIIASGHICQEKKVDILVYFHSAIGNFQRRRILRETWANKNSFKEIAVKTVFMLGRTNDFMEQMKLQNENLVYGDIVQGDFLDTHQNLTLKAIMVTRWISDYCAHARYVIKSDDDIFVNIFLFVEKLISTMWHRPKTIACHLRKSGSTPIVRDQKSKWYVAKHLLPGKTVYPQFCPGFALIFSADLAPIMYSASFNAAFIPIDDVYMFGLLLEKEKDVSFINVQSNFTLNQKLGLEEYGSNQPIDHIVSNAWESGAMEKFWFLTLGRLSPWALRHSSFAIIEKRRKLLNVTIA